MNEEQKRALIEDVRKTVVDIDNDDKNIDLLFNAMEYFCSNHDICEGYKHAILGTLNNQADNHFDELECEDLEQLLNFLTGKKTL